MGGIKRLLESKQEEDKEIWIKEQLIYDGVITEDEEVNIYSKEYEEYEVQYSEIYEDPYHNHEEDYEDYKDSEKTIYVEEGLSSEGLIENDDPDLYYQRKAAYEDYYDSNVFKDYDQIVKDYNYKFGNKVYDYLITIDYDSRNIVLNKNINNYEFDILVSSKKNEFLAVLEIKDEFNEDIKEKLVKYTSIFKEEQSIIPRIFLIIEKDDNLSFFELINNNLEQRDTLPSYKQLKARLNEKFYKTNINSIATYRNDTPDEKDDCLNISADVDSFAKLVTYRNSAMPLSIGLFGKWGSGKSFFMKELESKIKDYSNINNQIFCKDVVHIKFNAWHYSDTNLWASLTYKIFEEIDNKFSKPGNNIHSLYENLESSKNEIKIKYKEKEDLEAKIEKVNQEISKNQNKLEIEKKALKDNDLFDFTKAILTTPTVTKQLNKIRKTIGLENDTIEDIVYINNELKSWFGILEKIIRDEKLSKLIMYLCIFLISIGLIYLNYEEKILNYLKFIGPFMVIIILYIGKIKSKVKKLKDARFILNNIIDNWHKSKDYNIELTYQKIKNNESLISELESNTLLKEREILSLEKRQSIINNEIEDIKSGKYFKDFIKSKVSSSDYKKHLGLISLIRKDLTELEVFLSKKNEREFNIDRIVLYIDDLDRCNDTLVVEVLEAIHLLLAFKLFVVVIGIDLRWIKNSLSKKYSVLNSTDNDLSPKDYIEKIFQIPFRVNSLNNQHKTNLINNLFDKNNLSYFKNKIRDESIKTITTLENVIAKDQIIEIKTTTISTENRYEELELTKDEVEYINKLIKYIHNLPRTINRFVNTYRVLRSHEIVQKALEESFYNYKTIVLFIIEIFWNEKNEKSIKFINEFKNDYENTFENRDEVKKLIQRFGFDD